MALFHHRKTLLRAFSVAAALSAAAFVPSCLQSAYTADAEVNPLSPVSFTYHAKDGTLIELTALTDNSVRVRSTKNKTFSNKPEFILTGAKPRAFTKVRQNADGFTCTIDDLSVRYQGSAIRAAPCLFPTPNTRPPIFRKTSAPGNSGNPRQGTPPPIPTASNRHSYLPARNSSSASASSRTAS